MSMIDMVANFCCERAVENRIMPMKYSVFVIASALMRRAEHGPCI